MRWMAVVALLVLAGCDEKKVARATVTPTPTATTTEADRDALACWAVARQRRAADATALPGGELAGRVAEPRARARRRSVREAVGSAAAVGKRRRARASAAGRRSWGRGDRPTSGRWRVGAVAGPWWRGPSTSAAAIRGPCASRAGRSRRSTACMRSPSLAVAFAPDGKVLVAYSVDRAVRAVLLPGGQPFTLGPASKSRTSRPRSALAAGWSWPGRRSTPARSATSAAASTR